MNERKLCIYYTYTGTALLQFYMYFIFHLSLIFSYSIYHGFFSLYSSVFSSLFPLPVLSMEFCYSINDNVH